MFISLAALSLVVSLSPTTAQQPQSQQVVVPQPVQLTTPAQTVVPLETSVAVQPTVVLEQPAFGHRGQKVIKGSTSATVFGQHLQTNGEKSDSYGFSISPVAGAFVANHLFIGGALNAGLSGYGSNYLTSVGVGPVVGFYKAVNPGWGFLPTLTAAYHFTRSHTAGGTPANTDYHGINISIDADVVVHLTEHLSMIVGPFVSQSVYDHAPSRNNTSLTTYGINAGILGWM